ncbi:MULTISPECIES: DUF2726 domain-containing protein [Acinetobacter]|jgi:hypothetical protein|uniref:DUF2726 domain-containing protein n=1 Tax=Acinetobacter lwoffii TaxID=28090 RepID=A0AAJ3AJ85_ACILW|nr:MULTISPECIES: hypothetical protein [Bacteria]KGH51173.1 hypothetical protein GS19_03440 [Acinetobacter idrijaensis]MBA4068856.1 hypothetical protein [Acinetobacter sp.]ODN54269.1 hypothetical protein A9Z54_05185 [Acinetobacter sp. 51m]RDC52679.1 hypothetical protein DVA85_07595 [Acinetobacter sp. RIT592]AUC06611.1 hypothetical protein BVG18_06715 [Acinetobacter lwoffii]
MTTYIMIGSFLLFCVVLMAWKKLGNNSKPQDSALKQRAIFNLNEQLTFTRLREVLPEYIILAHVSYDALMTTKFNRTRHKYRNLTADFVILDQQHQILAVVGVDDPLILKRPQQTGFQDALLTMAGYRVIRYDDVPEYYQLRQDFLQEQAQMQKMPKYTVSNDLKKYYLYSDLERSKIKAVG